jgi:hypothetical protein
MKKSMKKIQQPTTESQIIIKEPTVLEKPSADTKFAKEAAKFLVDIIKKNNWSRNLGGQSEHIQYEGWQTAGKFYGYTVKTFDAEYVEYGGVWGFKAKAIVVNEKTGIEIGGAEALCMSDEYNWKNKPKFQLASMAQTRAGSKALRQNLGFVVALAGFSATPAEEMEDVRSTIGGGRAANVQELVEPTTSSSESENNTWICMDCGNQITEKVRSYSEREFGRALCFDDQAKARKAQHEAR